MSEATKTALDDALAAHVADECDGSLVSGYVLQACYFNGGTVERGTTGYFREFSDDIPFHSSLGLANMLIDGLKDSQFDGDDDED